MSDRCVACQHPLENHVSGGRCVWVSPYAICNCPGVVAHSRYGRDAELARAQAENADLRTQLSPAYKTQIDAFARSETVQLNRELTAERDALRTRVAELSNLCAAAYQIVGAIRLEADTVPLLDALTAATRGEPIGDMIEQLLPYVMPEDANSARIRALEDALREILASNTRPLRPGWLRIRLRKEDHARYAAVLARGGA